MQTCRLLRRRSDQCNGAWMKSCKAVAMSCEGFRNLSVLNVDGQKHNKFGF